jgi:hypothetical protein
MKKSQLILLTIFLVLTALIYVVLSSNKKEFDKDVKQENTTVFVPVTKVKNELKMLVLTSYGQILPNSEVIISFEVQGELQKGEVTMKPGTNFREGQILYRVNNKEAYYTLSARKTGLSNLIINMMPDIELDFPAQKQKWTTFLNALQPDKMLPALPEINSDKERMFLTSRNILTEYYNLKSLEVRMEKYFYLAPFNGTVIAVYSEPGAIANPGGQIAKIAKTGDFEVKVPISMDDLQLYKENSAAEFYDSKNEKIATGKIIRISDVINQQTQSADVYYSVKPLKDKNIYNGMFLNVSINKKAQKETVTLPRSAVKDGVVKVLKDSKLIPIDVVIVSSKPDSVYVTGLSDGQQAVLEQVEEVKGKVTYSGVVR